MGRMPPESVMKPVRNAAPIPIPVRSTGDKKNYSISNPTTNKMLTNLYKTEIRATEEDKEVKGNIEAINAINKFRIPKLKPPASAPASLSRRMDPLHAFRQGCDLLKVEPVNTEEPKPTPAKMTPEHDTDDLDLDIREKDNLNNTDVKRDKKDTTLSSGNAKTKTKGKSKSNAYAVNNKFKDKSKETADKYGTKDSSEVYYVVYTKNTDKLRVKREEQSVQESFYKPIVVHPEKTGRHRKKENKSENTKINPDLHSSVQSAKKKDKTGITSVKIPSRNHSIVLADSSISPHYASDKKLAEKRKMKEKLPAPVVDGPAEKVKRSNNPEYSMFEHDFDILPPTPSPRYSSSSPSPPPFPLYQRSPSPIPSRPTTPVPKYF